MSPAVSSPLPSCFRPSTSTKSDDYPYPPPPQPPLPPLSTKPNLATYLYHTDQGLVSLTWSRSILGRSLHVQLHHPHQPFDSPPLNFPTTSSSSSSSSFQLHIKPFVFWKKHGSKKLSPRTHIFWSLSKAKFGSGPEPYSGFYVALVVDNEITLLVGDSIKDAYAKTKAQKPKSSQLLVQKREHVVANKIYTTRTKIGGKMREIQIDCGYSDNSKLCFSVDNQRVLEIKRLKWKFRGNERIELEGIPIHISWDVYNWLFDGEISDGHAVFMFKFEEEEDGQGKEVNDRSLINFLTQQSLHEWGKIGKNSSSSSVSMSSSAGSFGASSSVMEWASTEENELAGPIGFSLLVYAWKR